MFEAADPRWAAKANKKLRKTLAEKKRQSLAARAGRNREAQDEEDDSEVDADYEYEKGESVASSGDEEARRMTRASAKGGLSTKQAALPRLNTRPTGPAAMASISDDDDPHPHLSLQMRARASRHRIESEPASRMSAHRNTMPSSARPTSARRSSSQAPAKRRRTEVIEIKSEPEDTQEPTPAPTPQAEPEPVWHTIDQCLPGCGVCAAAEAHRIPASSLRRLMRTETQFEAVRTENERLRNRLADRERQLAEAETKLKDKETALRDKETIIELQRQLAARQ